MPATLRSRIPQIMAQLPEEVRDAIEDGAEQIASEAKSRVPVETGALREAIHTELTPNGVRVVAGDTDAFYGHMVEFGTAHSAAHPFLVPAYEANREEVLLAVRRAMGIL